jgi:hypothetical protein
MKILITENKLYEVFVKYMDSQYDLVYNIQSREFIDKDRNTFGWIVKSKFLYTDLQTENALNSWFGSDTNKLLLHYLQNRFPGVTILSVED